ncbi:cell wall integrity and stress response subunit 4 precursor, putative [Candida dubliniensis CD36]|uniref:Cell wall integrity and stress response subunit 4, putative n=1 Tax=Candida dubliniensis (strain CD36 / ATCC MYA-646 / CBS 7987 / NCPF 3949 / NRRL Y-17841) TaxID=573826 RepID=B9WA52_CANDC|nr:cell wall integrity and stress response subunit 4 precursor, putative [Candida dubliniensis CD36]CAX45690.1 cell wall integrity and stress response subunit 4 precursor, putative [Candida dubliniensis CD36]
MIPMSVLHSQLLAILLYISLTHALSLSRCSSTNLGGEKTSSEFMSNGLCRDTCSKDGYAVAILSGNDCYCTNDVPADTADMSNCEIGCPGYKDEENCAGGGYFGYLLIGQPSATVGGETSTSSKATKTSSSSTSSSTSSTSTTSSSSTSTSTSTSSTSSSTSTSASSTSSSTSTSTSSTSSSTSTSTSSTSSSTSTSTSSTSSSTTISTTSSSPDTPSTSSPPTTMVTKTTQVTETHRSSDVVQVTQYSTEVLTVSPSTTSKSKSTKSSSQTPIVSTKIEQTTAYSIKTVNGTQTQEIKTLYITQFTTQSTSDSTTSSTSFESISHLRSQDASTAPTSSAPSSSPTAARSKDTFFDDKGKVAGTFTAVGIVVVGIVGAMLYCCCCFGGAGGRNNDHDGYSDEENQYSSDELSVNHATVVAPYSKHSSFSTLKRNSSSKTLFAYFTGDNNKDNGVNRSSSRRKLMSRRSSQMSSSPNINNPEVDAGAMFPINEIDSRLDPDTMFLNQNFSNKSLGDNQDYSRKLKITNPE